MEHVDDFSHITFRKLENGLNSIGVKLDAVDKILSRHLLFFFTDFLHSKLGILNRDMLEFESGTS